MSDKLQRARHIRPNPPDPTDGSAAPLGRHGRPSASGDGDAPQAQGAPRNNPRANAEARIPARGRHRGVSVLRPTGRHRALSSAPMRASATSPPPPRILAAGGDRRVTAEDGREPAQRGQRRLSASRWGRRSLISICVIISRITVAAPGPWPSRYSTFVSSSYQVANNLPGSTAGWAHAHHGVSAGVPL
ncbi:MAG: hypothetical protein ACLUW6_04010 [Coriobacteriaceae bacterium]